jgi:hypothetical protein
MLLAAVAPNARGRQRPRHLPHSPNERARRRLVSRSASCPPSSSRFSKLTLVYWSMEGFSSVLWAGQRLPPDPPHPRHPRRHDRRRDELSPSGASTAAASSAETQRRTNLSPLCRIPASRTCLRPATVSTRSIHDLQTGTLGLVRWRAARRQRRHGQRRRPAKLRPPGRHARHGHDLAVLLGRGAAHDPPVRHVHRSRRRPRSFSARHPSRLDPRAPLRDAHRLLPARRRRRQPAVRRLCPPNSSHLLVTSSPRPARPRRVARARQRRRPPRKTPPSSSSPISSPLRRRRSSPPTPRTSPPPKPTASPRPRSTASPSRPSPPRRPRRNPSARSPPCPIPSARSSTTPAPNGLRIANVRVPIGVIGIIYEARPNVTIDCAILCLKSGNASILRGGKEIFHTNTAFAALIAQALAAAGLPADAVQLIPTTDRAALTALLKLDTLIHCIIPRGGEGLIRFVAQNSTIPVIKHYTGVCFVYLDRDADPAIAEKITLNAKVQRPGVCNAAEQLLVHADVADTLLPRVATRSPPKACSSAAMSAPPPSSRARASPRPPSAARRLHHRVPRTHHRSPRRRLPRHRRRGHQPRQLRPHRRDHHRATRPPPAASNRRGLRRRHLERQHPLQRRLRIRLRRRDRHQHRPPPRPRPDGPARVVQLQVS